MFCSPSRQHMRSRPKTLSPFDVTTKSENEMPSIQALMSGSFSPAVSVTSASSSSNDVSSNHENQTKIGFIRPGYQLSIDDVNDLMMAPQIVEEYTALQQPSSTRSYFQDDECYVSMEYSKLKQLSSIQNEIKLDSKLRKSLIEEELNQLIQVCQEYDYLSGHEFEPEAIEAMGIAANQLAYRKKYYDVARSHSVYVPSVAYAVMSGALLEVASAHYFGKSEEFLVAYAGAMGSAIMRQKSQYHKYMTQEREECAIAEEFDVQSQADDDSREEETVALDSDQVMRLVWGVSPTASSMIGGKNRFTFDEENVSSQGRRWKVLVFIFIIALTWSAAVSFLPQSQRSWMKDVATATLASSKSAAVEMPRIVQETWNPIQTWTRESKNNIAHVGAFWKEQLAELKEHIKEETMPYQKELFSSLYNPILHRDATTTFVQSPLFGARAKQKAALSVEEFQEAINGKQEVVTKKLLANMEGSDMRGTQSIAVKAKATQNQNLKKPIVPNLLY